MALQAKREELIRILKHILCEKAGFPKQGMPLIIDNSLGVRPERVAAALRGQGLQARSVNEIFGTAPGDPVIRRLAEYIDGRVVAVDKGATPGEGFLHRALHISGRVRTEVSVIRLVEEALR